VPLYEENTYSVASTAPILKKSVTVRHKDVTNSSKKKKLAKLDEKI
jgi:hypothetical protein